MGQTLATRQVDTKTPPRQGQITVLATGITVATQDLRLIGPQTVSNNAQTPGLPGHYARFEAVGADCYVAFAPTAGALAGITAASTGANGANCAFDIPQNTFVDFWLEPGVDLFVGFITSAGTGTIRIFQVSP